MDIRWTTALLDIPLDTYRDTVDFWCAVTDSRMSSRRGSSGEYQTLLPREPGVDAFLRSQMFDDGPRVHLDLHVSAAALTAERDATLPTDREERRAAARAAALADGRDHALARGASLVHDAGTHVVLTSPGGFVFCLVGDNGETARPGPVGGAIVDQLCLDVPAPLFESEVTFWESLTGWEASGRGDLVPLRRPEGQPLRLLLQRLGDDPRATVTAHLDLAVGRDRTAVVESHLALGARLVGHGRRWTTLLDPSGLPYCLTDRDPTTGLLDQS